MDSSREDLPRVSVGTVQDWQRLESNYKRATLSHLDQQILAKSLTTERDALLKHINQFIDQTLKAARPNLRINGQNYESLDHGGLNVESFDEVLDRRIWSLADTRLQWQKRIADTRRKVPTEIENTFTDLLKQQQVADAEMQAKSIAELIEDKNDGSSGDEPLPRYPQIEEGFHKTLTLGDELDQTIPSQLERADRVRMVAAEVKALKP
ncbi:hypothetical protein BDZ94DRAFT_221698 [Collybia nuda]|uniref:Uncharacterized protein n=1 Tax=Collybia nuda TaxID=64659 RepID=A0A9P6CLL6_9AGAR|nr:hypothetical protein BDZ94DRAFT_221698 [Collybia nuda]